MSAFYYLRCAQCQRRRRTDKFWKWFRGRFTLRSICVGCEPSEAPVEGAPISAHVPQPKGSWDSTVRALAESQRWCTQAVQKAPRASTAWGDFLSDYANVLQSIQRRIEAMQGWGSATHPFDYFLSPETLRRLKEEYDVADPDNEQPFGCPPCFRRV
jgi:hypothetical protein